MAAGNPVMESYPRQCRANGETFVEEVKMEAPSFTACEDPRPEFCTLEYNPVCALRDNGVRCVTEPCPSFDAVTSGNSCSACGDANVTGYYPGACEDIQFVICEDVQTGFDVRAIAEENGWVCLDVCPGNYDPYTTQIGAQMCIPHYGEEEISQWPVCEASSESCNCVKATETTSNEPIENAQFRCVPDQYAERMLFRSGQERLDENGELGVAIA